MSRPTIIISILFIAFLGQIKAQRITRGPYLQQPTLDGITIRFRTDSPSIPVINLQDNNKNNILVKTAGLATTEHIVVLTDLLPNTTYRYSIKTSEKDIYNSEYQYFGTLPSNIAKQPISFWAMGDFGASATEKYRSNQEEVRQQFLKHKNGRADLWVWLGDNAYCCGFQSEYQTQIFDFYGEKLFGNMPILPSPGNHEYYGNYPEFETLRKSRAIPYFDMFTMPTKGESGGVPSSVKAYYSVDYGNIHFVSLDSYGYDDGQFPLADKRSKQYQWLERDLAANKQLWTVVFFHHPPYTKRSHDSDAEPELTAIRESLVPVFDKYKVDLVLSGHSHVYERSFLMKNHVGHSTTFNKSIHAVRQTKAFYTVDSPPIINKNEGTIYMVIGSAGRLDWNQQLDAHPSSVYSNYEIGGSALFTVNENRLDGEWICADGKIRDKFTVFKNVNKTADYRLIYGDSLSLTASWRGSYKWSTKQLNQSEITISPRKNSLITVTDSLGFLTDSFFVSVSPQPIVKTILDSAQAICEGKSFTVGFELQHTNFEKWTYRVELSDANGNFEKSTLLGEGKQKIFEVMIPTSIALQNGNYRVRVIPDANYFEVIPSKSFVPKTTVSGKFTNVSPLPFSEEVTLTILLTGTLPARLKVSTFNSQVVDYKEIDLKVKQADAAIYKIEELSNACGNGIIDAKVIEILAPLSSVGKLKSFSIYPNPSNDYLIVDNLVNDSPKGVYKIISTNGKVVSEETIHFFSKTKIPIQQLPAGLYFLEIELKGSISKLRFVKD